MSDKHLHAIIVSQYRRTLQTGLPASQRLQLTPQIDQRVNEIDNGVIEQLDERVWRERYPETNAHLRQRLEPLCAAHVENVWGGLIESARSAAEEAPACA